MHPSRLQKLCISEFPLQDMPCIEALTVAERSLHEFRLDVQDYARGSRAFDVTAAAASPCSGTV
jgi:hypothetical protein